jgi:hypothetical protein
MMCSLKRSKQMTTDLATRLTAAEAARLREEAMS